MAYGIDPAAARREVAGAGRFDKPKANTPGDVKMVELVDDLDDDVEIVEDDQELKDKPQPDPVDYELLISVAHGLGKWMQDVNTGRKLYVKDPDCVGCLKDLQRFLRRDDPDLRHVFCRLGEWRLAAGDLVPLLITYPHDKEVTLQTVKVLTYLTMPVDPATAKPELQEGYVRDVKEAMMQQDALAAVLSLVAEPLAAHPRMSPEQQSAVQLVLALLRNLLVVPDEAPSHTLAAGAGRTRLQASLLSQLFSESIMELLLLVTQHGAQHPLRREAPVLLEILTATFAGITPEQLLAAKPPAPPTQPSCNQHQPPHQPPPGPTSGPQRTNSNVNTSGSGGGNNPHAPAPAAKSAARPSPAAFHPTGKATIPGGMGVGMMGGSGRTPSAAGPGVPPPSTGASGVRGGGPPRPLESAVAAQLRRQQLAAAAKLRGGAGVVGLRPGGGGGRFVVSHADDPGQRRTFLARPVVGRSAATAVKEQIVEAPRKLGGPRPPPASSARRDALLLWQLRGFADDLLSSGYNQVMEVIRRDVSAGVSVGRLERPDLIRFLNLAAFFTQYCRLKQEAHPHTRKPTTAAAAAGAAAAGATSPGGGSGSGTTAAAVAAPVDPSSPSAAPPPPSPFSGISGTMGWDTFHLVCKLWVEQADSSARMKDWELQAVSMRLLCEMLAVLVVAHRYGSPEDREAADRLQRRLLHDDLQESGMLPVLSRLMSSFNPARQSRSHACDLMMATHYVLRMYDRLTALEPGGFMVRAKKRRGGGRRRKQQQEDGEGEREKEERGEGEEGNEEGQEEGIEEGEGEVKGGGRGGGRSKAPLEELEEGSGAEDSDGSDEEGGGSRNRVVERPLDLATKVRGKLAQPAVIYFAVQLLACYRHLPPAVPRAIASLLYRIAGREHLDLEPLLYQISVLRVFYSLLSDPELRSPAKLPAYREVLLLATRVVRGLFRKLVPEKYGNSTQQQGQGAAAGGEAGGEEEVEGGGDPEAAATAAKRKQRRQELVAEIHDKAPRMLLVDMLFWKDATGATAINQDYWLWMALEEREGEEAEAGGRGGGGGRSGGAGGTTAARRRRGGDAWGDDEGGEEGAGGDGEAPPTGGRLRRLGGGVRGWEEEDGEEKEEEGGDGGGGTQRGRLLRGGGARAADTDGEAVDDGEEGLEDEGVGAAARGRQSGGAGRGGAVWSDEEGGRQQGAERRPAPREAPGAAAAAAAPRKVLTLQEREEMLRKRFMKTVRVGNGRNKRSGTVQKGPGEEEGGGGGGGGGGRGLRLNGPQRALLLQLFESYNSSRHNADIIVGGMGRGGAAAGEEGEGSEAAAAVGLEMSVGQLMRQLKNMGLKFRQLTENQISRLQSLFSRYRSDPDCALMIAAQLPGGWSSKDVKRFLIKHGLVEGRRPRGSGRRGGGSSSASDSGSDSGVEDPSLDEEELGVLWEQHGGQSDAVEQITTALLAPVPAAAVERKLRRMGLLPGKQARSRTKRGSKREAAGGPAELAALRQLWEEHKERPDHLNVIAAMMPGGKTVKQVQRLLRSSGLLDDDAGRRKRVRDAAERSRLVGLYQQVRGQEDPLGALAEMMPELTGGAKQVAKLLRKHGLLEGPRRTRRESEGEEEEGRGHRRGGRKGGRREQPEGAEQDTPAGPAAPRGPLKVPEPNPDRILQALAGIQEAYDKDRRWMSASAAAAWVAKQLDAAEALWGSAGGGVTDWCLVMTCDQDEDFFMTECAQDLLDACGIRNTADDYFKISAASTPEWRQRVRQALQGGLAGLGSERAGQLAAELRERRAAEEVARRREQEAREAAEAARATALFGRAAGRTIVEKGEGGAGRGRGGRGRRGGRGCVRGGEGAEEEEGGSARGRRRVSGGRGRRRRASSHEDEEAEAEKEEQEEEVDEQEEGGRPNGAASASDRSGSGSGSSSSSSSSGSSEGSGSESDAEEGAGGEGGCVVMPNYGTSSSEEVEGVGRAGPSRVPEGGGRGGGGKKGAAAVAAPSRRRPVPGALEGSSGSEGEEDAPTRRKAAAAAGAGRATKPTAPGARARAGSGATGSKGTGPEQRTEAPEEEEGDGGAGPRVGIANADARRRALAELARRREEQARRAQGRLRGALVPTEAPQPEELGGGEAGEEEGGEAAAGAAGVSGAAVGRRRRDSSDGALQEAMGAGGGGLGEDEEEGGGNKRRRLLRRTATAGLGSGKENVGHGDPGGVSKGPQAAAGGRSGGAEDEEMIELEDGLEDF